ncbi:MAG TPA: carbonic anhydrase [Rhodanobacteraceae bacterium]|nr:carbonic anhydrase [Rhodanobacteraceae bacterium]
MPNTPSELLAHNRHWAEQTTRERPDLFDRLGKGQTPDYLWISCSDSRVSPNQALEVDPGEVFVHRNISNVIVQSDLNALSVIQYAVEALKVGHALMVGHYGCGGCAAAMKGDKLGLIDNWLAHVAEVAHRHADKLDAAADEHERHTRLCELNAIEQAVNLCHTTVLREAWQRGQKLTVHTWMYGLADGLVHDLGMDVDGPEALMPAYRKALASLEERWAARA